MSADYRFRRADFKPLPVKLEHLDIYLNFTGGRVEADGTLRMTARRDLDSLALDARELEIASVEWIEDGPAIPLQHVYRREQARLEVALPGRVAAGRRFSVRIRSACVPSDRVLEGIYLDSTPPGCPPQYMSQFQQWGFQRVLPIFDDCTAKCTMTTTLEADARYTHLISNGDVCRRRNPAGRPVPKAGDPSRQVVTYVNPIPMAPYLFLACAGTWDVLEDEVVYPSGRRVKLEYLVPPGRRDGAVVPMAILKDSVLWQGRTQEYEYAREVYRTICMEKSNFGGMENVGNTTILTEAALVDRFTTDRRLVYAHGVIVHEFEHNQCGSDVTMETPFDMWLNEAFTVDVERQYLHRCFDPGGRRLEEVDDIRAPLLGPLAIEDGGHLGHIVREGFNDPDELVDGLTYVKAAEVIRMLRLAIGPEAFRRAKNRYFATYAGGNANTDQFFACFEQESGSDLSAFRREWLHTIGYPRVSARHRYDAAGRRLAIRFEQTRSGKGGPFHVPIEMAAVGADGRDIPGTSRTVQMTGPALDLEIEGVPEPAFMSYNRDFSFYGTFEDRSATPASLRAQIRLDPNPFNRVEAMRRLTEIERLRLVRDPAAAIDPGWVAIYLGLVADRALPPGLKAFLLRIDETPLDRDYMPRVRELCAARLALMRAVAGAGLGELLEVFRAVDTYRPAARPSDGVDERKLKAVLLRVLVEADTPEVHREAEAHFRAAWNISDKLAALACVNQCGHPRRRELMEEAYGLWGGHVSAYAAYLATAGAGIGDEAFEALAREEARPSFRIEHPSHSRALFLSMAANSRMLWTERGLAWIAQTVIRVARVNENTANRMLNSFQLWARFEPGLRARARAALEAMRAGVDAAASPSTAGRLAAYLADGA